MNDNIIEVWSKDELMNLPMRIEGLEELRKQLSDYLANVSWAIAIRRDKERLAK